MGLQINIDGTMKTMSNVQVNIDSAMKQVTRIQVNIDSVMKDIWTSGGTWSSGGNLATARAYLAGCGTQTAGLSFGGNDSEYLAVTEEYTKAT